MMSGSDSLGEKGSRPQGLRMGTLEFLNRWVKIAWECAVCWGIATWEHILLINADAGQIAFQESLPCHFFQPLLSEDTEEIKRAWVFLEGMLCLSLVARVSAGVCAMQEVMTERATPWVLQAREGDSATGDSQRQQFPRFGGLRRFHSRIQVWPYFPCASETWPGIIW